MTEKTTRTNNSDGSVTTTAVTYDEHGNETSRTTSTTAGPGSVVGIQAGHVEGATVIVNGKRQR